MERRSSMLGFVVASRQTSAKRIGIAQIAATTSTDLARRNWRTVSWVTVKAPVTRHSIVDGPRGTQGRGSILAR